MLCTDNPPGIYRFTDLQEKLESQQAFLIKLKEHLAYLEGLYERTRNQKQKENLALWIADAGGKISYVSSYIADLEIKAGLPARDPKKEFSPGNL